MPSHGTFAKMYVVDAAYVEKKTNYLTWEEAGVLALPALMLGRQHLTDR